MSKQNLPKNQQQPQASESLPTSPAQGEVQNSESSPPHGHQPVPVPKLSVTRAEYQGPIPHAAELERYEKIEKGLSSRIIGMTERAVDGEIQSHHMIIRGSISLQRWSLLCGTLIVLLCVIAGYLLMMADKDGYGYSLIIGAIASLMGAFLWGKQIESKIENRQLSNVNSEKE